MEHVLAHVLKETAKFVHKHLASCDWVQRHQHFDELARAFPQRFLNLCRAFFSPDDLLQGSCTGVSAPSVIVLKDKPRKRQMTLEEMGVVKRLRP